MKQILFWLYLVNTVVLILHEIDSAYWQEWKLFHLLGDEPGFLLVHIPILALVLFGLVLIERGLLGGLILSLVLCCGGIFAFSIHYFLMHRGCQEFKTPISQGILWVTMMLSLMQLGATLVTLV